MHTQVHDATGLPMDLASVAAAYVTCAPPTFEMARHCSTCNRDYKEVYDDDSDGGDPGAQEYALGQGGLCAPDGMDCDTKIELWERGYCGKTMCFNDELTTTDSHELQTGGCMAIHTEVASKCFQCAKLNHLDPDFNIFEVHTTRNKNHTLCDGFV
jgi:hypothetical protein